MGHRKMLGIILSVVMLVGLWAAPAALARGTTAWGDHERGAGRESPAWTPGATFAVAQPLGPIYNNLVVFDPHNYPQIIGDLAKSWSVSDDYLTYTFTLHQGSSSTMTAT